jgi:hypothetical protein
MRYRFVLDGAAYSAHKDAFKRIMKRHGLRWRGTFDNPWWGSAAEKVRATYERDETKGVTVRATLVWEGRTKTAFLEELKAWVFECGGESEALAPEAAPESIREDVDRQLALWDAVHKPDVEGMKRRGAPARWIERRLEEWRHRREEKRRELLTEHGL